MTHLGLRDRHVTLFLLKSRSGKIITPCIFLEGFIHVDPKCGGVYACLSELWGALLQRDLRGSFWGLPWGPGVGVVDRTLNPTRNVCIFTSYSPVLPDSHRDCDEPHADRRTVHTDTEEAKSDLIWDPSAPQGHRWAATLLTFLRKAVVLWAGVGEVQGQWPVSQGTLTTRRPPIPVVKASFLCVSLEPSRTGSLPGTKQTPGEDHLRTAPHSVRWLYNLFPPL